MGTKSSKKKPSREALLRDSRVELKRLLAEREWIVKKTKEVDQQIVEAVANVLAVGDNDLSVAEERNRGRTEGLTNSIRSILRRSKWLSPPQIRDAMRREGISLSDGKPLIKVHVILKRLVEKGEVEMVSRGPHKKLFQWKR